MRIVLCDDDKAFIQQLDKTLQEYFQEIHTKCPEIACFYSGEALLADTGAKDIVFLDIEMNGIDGICVGSALKKKILTVLFLSLHLMRNISTRRCASMYSAICQSRWTDSGCFAI